MLCHHTLAVGASNSFCLSNWNIANPRGKSHSSRPFDQKRFGVFIMNWVVWKTNAFKFSLFVLFCSCFYVYFLCSPSSPAHGRGELLSGIEDKDK